MIAADTSALLAVVLGEPEAERFLALLRGNAVTISAVSLAEALIVAEARQGHPAALNFGDCFAYASASLANLSLLFK